jgi:hypothetical protein
MLIFVSLAYVVLTLPRRLAHTFMTIPAIARTYDLTVLYWRKKYMTVLWSVTFVWMSNHAVNFYMYCIGGGRKYRKDAREVLKQMSCL